MPHEYVSLLGFLASVLLILSGGLFFISGIFRYAAIIDRVRYVFKLHGEYPIWGHRAEFAAAFQLAVGIIMLLIALFILNW